MSALESELEKAKPQLQTGALTVCTNNVAELSHSRGFWRPIIEFFQYSHRCHLDIAKGVTLI